MIAGTRRYAEAVTRVLDPRRQYIKDRIVSRCDVSGVRNEGNDKSLERLFLGDTSLAVVIDDREDVWRGEQSHQLILVKPFVYFSGKGVEVNSRPDGDGLGNASTGQPLAPIVSLLYPGKVLGSAKPFAPEFGDLDDQLWRCLQVLHNIHSKIYSNGSKTNSTNKINSVAQTIQLPLLVEKRKVSDTLIEIKESILAGCTITFSGLIPTNTLRPRQHYLWKLAESLGAQVSQEVLPRTTHLLAMVPPDQKKTAKISECLQRGDVWVVHPDWLIYCRWSLARSAEASFMLYALEPGMQLPAPKLRFDTIAPVQNQSISGQSDNNKRPSSTLLNDNLSEEDRSDDEDRIGKFAKRARTENYDESSKKLSEVLKKAHTIRNPSVVGLLGDDDPEDRLDWTEYENYVDCTHFDDDGDDEDNADYYKHYDNDGSEDYESKFDLARHSNPVVINVSNLDVRRKSRNNVNSEVVASRGMGDGSSDSSSDDCISRELTPIDPNPQTEDLLDGESSDDDFDDLEDILLSRSTK